VPPWMGSEITAPPHNRLFKLSFIDQDPSLLPNESRQDFFISQVAGRPLSPARDRWLDPTPNPTQQHRAAVAARYAAASQRGSVGLSTLPEALSLSLALEVKTPGYRTCRSARQRTTPYSPFATPS